MDKDGFAVILVTIIAVLLATFFTGWLVGERRGVNAGARQMARHILNPDFTTDRFVSIVAEERD